MRIPLKENFTFKNIADVHDGILYIHRLESFHDMMFEIAYSVSDMECKYCGKKLTRCQATMDHLYPVMLGGPYLPANLSVACSHCNEDKDSMIVDDYFYYLTLHKQEKKKYKVEYRMRIREELYNKTPLIPSDWFSYEDIDKISMVYVSRANKRLGKPRDFYKKYHRLRTPIIVDKNYKLLDGLYSYMIAKEFNVQKVPVIVLENVIVDKEFNR